MRASIIAAALLIIAALHIAPTATAQPPSGPCADAPFGSSTVRTCVVDGNCLLHIYEFGPGGYYNQIECTEEENVYRDGCVVSEWDTGNTYFVCTGNSDCSLISVGYQFLWNDPHYWVCLL